jgi:hypothetical protein
MTTIELLNVFGIQGWTSTLQGVGLENYRQDVRAVFEKSSRQGMMMTGPTLQLERSVAFPALIQDTSAFEQRRVKSIVESG